ncbi:MAG: hypothetical protein Q9218_007011, partial [Villophora microphyllina]
MTSKPFSRLFSTVGLQLKTKRHPAATFPSPRPHPYLPFQNNAMTELSFAKSFLATLDNRAIKLQPDHVADLKTLELKGP